MALSTSTTVFLISLLGIPITYLVNTAQTFHGQWTLFLTGVGSLLLVVTLVRLAVKRSGQSIDPFVYGNILFITLPQFV